MKWQQRTNRSYEGHVEEALYPGLIRKCIEGSTITKIEAVEGRPGGANNDCLTITLDGGLVLRVDAYSGGDMYVTLSDMPT